MIVRITHRFDKYSVQVIRFQMSRSNARDLLNELTEREEQVVKVFAFGTEREQAAKDLGMSYRTLESHVGKIRRKWQIPVYGWARVWFCAAIGE